MCRRFLLILTAVLLAACSPSGEAGVEGTLLYRDSPVGGAQVEVYLKGERDRSTLPFSVATTDEKGRYRIDLPPGRYFIIGKKKEETAGGYVRMLMAECPANPLEVAGGMKQVAAFSLREMGRDGGRASGLLS